MYRRKETAETPVVSILPATSPTATPPALAYTEAERAELRRQMYARIAQGHALASAEDAARAAR